MVLLLSHIHTWWLACKYGMNEQVPSLYIYSSCPIVYVFASLVSILTRSLNLENSHAHSLSKGCPIVGDGRGR